MCAEKVMSCKEDPADDAKMHQQAKDSKTIFRKQINRKRIS